jgi:hypothetical protein
MPDSSRSHKQRVLDRLRKGGWVDGTELATEEIGGSEGLSRLRELRDEGHEIDERRHPDMRQNVRQYRLAPTAPAQPVGGQTACCTGCGAVSLIVNLSSKYGPPQLMGEIKGLRLWEAKCRTCDKGSAKGLQAIWKEQE